MRKKTKTQTKKEQEGTKKKEQEETKEKETDEQQGRGAAVIVTAQSLAAFYAEHDPATTDTTPLVSMTSHSF